MIQLATPLQYYTVRDTTASHMHVDRGSMHPVEHYDDLFSWKKCSNYTFTQDTYKICNEMYNEFWTYTQSSHFVGCWLCCVTSWMSREHSLLIFSPLLLCLYCRLFQHRTGWVWLGLLNHLFTHFPQASSWDFWIWAIPWHSVQNIYCWLGHYNIIQLVT